MLKTASLPAVAKPQHVPGSAEGEGFAVPNPLWRPRKGRKRVWARFGRAGEKATLLNILKGSCWCGTRPGGFTMAEVLVVLFVIGIVLGFVLPKSGLIVNLSSATRQLIGTMRDTFIAASVTQRLHRLHFDLNEGSYWVTQVTPEGERAPQDPALARPIALSGPIKLQDVSTGSQGKVSAGRIAIAFFPAGYSDTAVVHLVDGSLNTATLMLNPLTGHVQVLDHYVEAAGPQPIPERLRPWFLMGFGQPPAPPAGTAP